MAWPRLVRSLPRLGPAKSLPVAGLGTLTLAAIAIRIDHAGNRGVLVGDVRAGHRRGHVSDHRLD